MKYIKVTFLKSGTSFEIPIIEDNQHIERTPDILNRQCNLNQLKLDLYINKD